MAWTLKAPAVKVPVVGLRYMGAAISRVVAVATVTGMVIGGPPEAGVSRIEIAALAGVKPVPVMVRAASGSIVIRLSEEMLKPAEVLATVTIAEADLVVSALLVAVTVTVAGLGTEAGAV